MKTIITVVLALFAVLSPIEAADTQKLVIKNQSGSRALVRIDHSTGSKVPVWEHMFSSNELEATATLTTGHIYPVQIAVWKSDGKAGDVFAYQALAGVVADTLVITHDAKLVRMSDKAAEAAGLVATPTDSLVGVETTPARVPEKYRKKSPKSLTERKAWELASWDTLSAAKQDSILLAEGKVLLTVGNLTADIFKFRVGHLWWEEQDGLLQDQSGIMIVDTDEHHELRRYIWSNGVLSGSMREDTYSFYVPRGVARYTVTFGGPQAGRVINQTNVAIKVATSMMTAPVIIPAQSSRDDIQCLTGQHIFTVYFGPDFSQRYHEIPFILNDQLADQQVQVVEEQNGKRIVRIKRVDFVATILPSDLRTARRIMNYKP